MMLLPDEIVNKCRAVEDADFKALVAHIDAQAARIAEQQAVIDQRNGECDRLINELAALREQKPIEYRVLRADGGVAAHANTKEEAECCVSKWNPEWSVQPVYAAPQPDRVVPDVLSEKFIDWVCLTCVDVRNASGDFEAQDSINDIRQALEEKAEVLRLNSGSKSDD